DLLDPSLELLRVRFRFLEVLFESLLVRSTGRHLDVCGERDFHLFLFAVCLDQILGQLGLLGRSISSHISTCSLVGCQTCTRGGRRKTASRAVPGATRWRNTSSTRGAPRSPELPVRIPGKQSP